jgi:orotate phosphoribosyltransferase
MDQSEVLWVLARHGAILRGHFVGTSGRHLDTYINKDEVYTLPSLVSQLCWEIARRFPSTGVDVVAAPAVGGVALSQWVAYHIGLIGPRQPHAVYAEKDGDRFVFRRGYDRLLGGCPRQPGGRVLVVEDVLTTGGSLKAVVEAVGDAGGTVVGAVALVNRGGVKAADVLPHGNCAELVALATLDLESWDESECPLCRDGVPVDVEVGKGREFLARRDKS